MEKIFSLQRWIQLNWRLWLKFYGIKWKIKSKYTIRKNWFRKNSNLNLKELSMGMSSDYLDAAKYSATFVRIGSKIFGARG